LLKIEFTCVSTVFGLRKSFAQMPAFERPSAIRDSTSRSRGLRSATGSSSRGRPTKRVTTSGSMAVPPRATRRTASRNSSMSSTRSFRR
jgi:hypothetical protein